MTRCLCDKCKHKEFEFEMMKKYQKYADKNNLEFVGLTDGVPTMRVRK